MAITNPVKELENAIGRLRAERAELMTRVAEIDASFGRLGIAVTSITAAAAPAPAKKYGKRLGRPPAAKPAKGKAGAKKGRRGKFGVSGDESILAFIKSVGRPNAAEVNVHWQKEGRAGTCNTPISKLVKEGKLKRVEVEGERGARYEIA